VEQVFLWLDARLITHPTLTNINIIKALKGTHPANDRMADVGAD